MSNLSISLTPAREELVFLLESVRSYETTLLEKRTDQAAQSALRCPVMKASSGLISLTLISGYVKEGKPRGAVYKCVRQHEVDSFRLYEKLLAPTKEGMSYGFLLPKTEVFSIQDPQIVELLKNSQTAADGGPRGAPEAVLAMEKIAGSSAGDFILEKYLELVSKELVLKKLHEKFFLRLGRLALFDLWMGNTDRLLRPVEEDGAYILDGMGASLGNIMVCYTREELAPYLIDNEIDPSLKQTAYCAFLQTLDVETLATQLKQAFLGGVEEYQENLMAQLPPAERSGTLTRAKEVFAQFRKDLSDIGVKKIREGMKQMAEFAPSMCARLDETVESERQLKERIKSFQNIEVV